MDVYILLLYKILYYFRGLRTGHSQPLRIQIERHRRTSEISTIGHTLVGVRVHAIRQCVAKSAPLSRDIFVHRAAIILVSDGPSD